MKNFAIITRNLSIILVVTSLVVFGLLLFDGSRTPTLTAAPDLQAATPTPTQVAPYPLPPAPATPTPRRSINSSSTTLDAYPLPQSNPTSTPTPASTPASLLTPPPPGHRDAAVITFNPSGTPNVQRISHSPPQSQTVTMRAATIQSVQPAPNYPVVPPSSQVVPSRIVTGPATFVNGWGQLMDKDFEVGSIGLPCDAKGPNMNFYTRTWGIDTYKHSNVVSSTRAIWPAKGGVNGITPTVGADTYPPDLSSWLTCGYFVLSSANNFMLRFNLWADITDPNDYLFVGVSTDGRNFQGTSYTSTLGSWRNQTLYFPNMAGQSQVWVGWYFFSDSNTNSKQGVWLDDLEVWFYRSPHPSLTYCAGLDPGAKGVALPPYEKAFGQDFPIIREGGTPVLANLVDSNAKWVRLGFNEIDGVVDLKNYDIMVDSLCASGIGVLGLVNHETLERRDYDTAATAVEYRKAFTTTVNTIVKHFNGRIKYWEVWNESNNPEGAFVAPVRFAPLLNDAAKAITQTNASAKVLFGGLAGAWNDNALTYFQQTYGFLGTARPFDLFAIHPYPDAVITHTVNPQIYLHAPDAKGPNDRTIVDKFFGEMQGHSDGNKLIWVTEIGWNNNLDPGGIPGCRRNVAVNGLDQALYLKPSFDILFNEVLNGGLPVVPKIFWFQYRDSGADNVCPNQNISWWYGLYNGNNQPKDVQCAFKAYPAVCGKLRYVFLPLINNNPDPLLR
jgi:hypothetical protein